MASQQNSNPVSLRKKIAYATASLASFTIAERSLEAQATQPVQAAAIVSQDSSSTSLPSLTQRRFRAVNNSPVYLSGSSFAPGSRARVFHEKISSQIRRGAAVSEVDLQQLFSALAIEDIGSLKSKFFKDYAKKFNSAEVVKIMIKSLIPAKGAKLSLPRDDKLYVHILRLKDLGNSFPKGTSIGLRRDFFMSFRNEADLGVRALGLALCVNANIKPQQDFKASEIIRASQHLSYFNRMRGDEFRLGVMLREALKDSEHFKLDDKLLDQIKMPLLRRGQTLERRYPGATEAMAKLSEETYTAFLSKQAELIVTERNKLQERVLFGAKEDFYSVHHSAPEFTDGPHKDIAKAFRLDFSKDKHVVRGSTNPRDFGAEREYLRLLDKLAQNATKETRVWHEMHGTNIGMFFCGGENGQAIVNLQDAQYIDVAELADKLHQLGNLPGLVFLTDTCEGWNYTESVNNKIIDSYKEQGKTIESIVSDVVLPTHVIGSQCQMLSVGSIVQWYDEDLPEDQRKLIKTTYSKLTMKLMAYSQAKALGVSIDELKEIGASDIPYKCTFGDFYEVDQLLAGDMEKYMNTLWAKQGKVVDFKTQTRRIDAAIFGPKLRDYDKDLNAILKQLKTEGYKLPQQFPARNKGPRNSRNTDHVMELS